MATPPFDMAAIEASTAGLGVAPLPLREFACR